MNDTYRPLSGLALGGFVVNAVFTVLVSLSAIVALVNRAPLFFPVWIVGIAALGILLCYAGQNQIRASEGTRTGLGLARYGLVLGLFSGLGYLAYSLAIGLAVGQQAETFLTGEPDSERG